MDLFGKGSIKFRFLTFDELIINIDRLSRFKLPEDTFSRVFYSIILKCLISPKYSKNELEKLNPLIISKLVKMIWNESVKYCCKNPENDTCTYKALKLIIGSTFKNIDKKTAVLINTKLNTAPVLSRINYNSAPVNLKFLIKVSELIKNEKDLNLENLINLRKKYHLKFPINKLLIVEGITEEILLPVFADKMSANLDKNGIYILGAGGKSKSPSLYLRLKDRLKIPIIMLFDADAKEICSSLEKTLIKKDRTIMIKKGEFEDILSLNLVKRALNKEYMPATPIIKDDLRIYGKMCENIENFYKSRHLGEFKKSKLSKIIAANIKYNTDITEEIKNIIFNVV